MKSIIYIGFPKTGTTYIQQLFKNNLEYVHNKDVLYPFINNDFKARTLKHIISKKKLSVADKREIDLFSAYIDEEVNTKRYSTILYSCEEISSDMMSVINKESLTKLKKYLSRWSDDFTVIAYVRKPSDYYLSLMQENLKRGGSIIDYNKFRSNFMKVIDAYESVFNADMIIRPFDKSKWHNSDLFEDFIHTVNRVTELDVAGFKKLINKSNETLSAEVMLVLNILRQYPTDFVGDKYDFESSEFLWRQLRSVSSQFSNLTKPKLYSDVTETINTNNVDDICGLRNKYSISFDDNSNLNKADYKSDTKTISALQNLIDVDVHKSLEILTLYNSSLLRLRK
ncbi:hypothetical protein [Thalassotalea eurytherma]|uniref:Sulfotransferase domain-containing protein n=1 Tax=Thalassotalea eurytherma TaxID=1144278 RepID=A0ABQ6H3G8_9GAMM|nr:hypothetical protein [Thalassotalea eurytherma]GLX81295.1 hypothetical protein theurythT_07470 [Thalassotalea eurytherma]